jgi:hypothetical protein
MLSIELFLIIKMPTDEFSLKPSKCSWSKLSRGALYFRPLAFFSVLHGLFDAFDISEAFIFVMASSFFSVNLFFEELAKIDQNKNDQE